VKNEMKNIEVSEDGRWIKGVREAKAGLEAWVKSALQIRYQEQQYLANDFGIDVVGVMRSLTPEEKFSYSIRKTLLNHPEIKDCSVSVVRMTGGKLIAEVSISSIYGTITLDQLSVMTQ
jgi:hypothetical protein